MTYPPSMFTYDWDVAGRPVSTMSPFGEITSRAYQTNNWLASQTDDNASGSLVGAASYAYNERGFVTDLTNTGPTGATLSEFGSTNPAYGRGHGFA